MKQKEAEKTRKTLKTLVDFFRKNVTTKVKQGDTWQDIKTVT